MADAIKTFLTDEGPKPVDYTALANLPTIPSTSDINTQINTKIAANCIGSTTDHYSTLWANLQALPDPMQACISYSADNGSIVYFPVVRYLAGQYTFAGYKPAGTGLDYSTIYEYYLGSSSFTFSSVATLNSMALSNITASEVANNDLAYLYDRSAGAAKKITVSELKKLTAPLSGTATCPAVSGWTRDSLSGLYYVTVSLTGVTTSHKLHLTPTIDTSDTDTGDAQQEAWDTHYYAKSVAGGVQFYAKEKPTVAVTFTWEATI